MQTINIDLSRGEKLEIKEFSALRMLEIGEEETAAMEGGTKASLVHQAAIILEAQGLEHSPEHAEKMAGEKSARYLNEAYIKIVQANQYDGESEAEAAKN